MCTELAIWRPDMGVSARVRVGFGSGTGGYGAIPPRSGGSPELLHAHSNLSPRAMGGAPAGWGGVIINKTFSSFAWSDASPDHGGAGMTTGAQCRGMVGRSADRLAPAPVGWSIGKQRVPIAGGYAPRLHQTDRWGAIYASPQV